MLPHLPVAFLGAPVFCGGTSDGLDSPPPSRSFGFPPSKVGAGVDDRVGGRVEGRVEGLELAPPGPCRASSSTLEPGTKNISRSDQSHNRTVYHDRKLTISPQTATSTRGWVSPKWFGVGNGGITVGLRRRKRLGTVLRRTRWEWRPTRPLSRWPGFLYTADLPRIIIPATISIFFVLEPTTAPHIFSLTFGSRISQSGAWAVGAICDCRARTTRGDKIVYLDCYFRHSDLRFRRDRCAFGGLGAVV